MNRRIRDLALFSTLSQVRISVYCTIFLVKLVRIRSRHSWLKIFKWLKGNAKKPMNSCSFFIDCYTKVDYLISTKVFGFWWLCCNHIIDYELLMQIVCVLVYACLQWQSSCSLGYEKIVFSCHNNQLYGRAEQLLRTPFE